MSDPTTTPNRGGLVMHEVHEWSKDSKDPNRLRVLRHGDGSIVYNVASIDTLSNPHAERDAEVIRRALDAAVSVPAPGDLDVAAIRNPEWLARVNRQARAHLDNLPAASRPAWYRAQVNGDDAWWESLVQAECDAGHVIFVDDGDGTVYACPACALAEARAALAARPAPVVSEWGARHDEGFVREFGEDEDAVRRWVALGSKRWTVVRREVTPWTVADALAAEPPFWRDLTTGEPCPRSGPVLCTITDRDHLHRAIHMDAPAADDEEAK